jgi:hypothetical protein
VRWLLILFSIADWLQIDNRQLKIGNVVNDAARVLSFLMESLLPDQREVQCQLKYHSAAPRRSHRDYEQQQCWRSYHPYERELYRGPQVQQLVWSPELP